MHLLLRNPRNADDSPLAVLLLRAAHGKLRLPATRLRVVCDGLKRAGDLTAESS